MKSKKPRFTSTSAIAISKTTSLTTAEDDSKPASDSGIEDVKNKFTDTKKSNTPFRRHEFYTWGANEGTIWFSFSVLYTYMF